MRLGLFRVNLKKIRLNVFSLRSIIIPFVVCFIFILVFYRSYFVYVDCVNAVPLKLVFIKIIVFIIVLKLVFIKINYF